MARPKLVSSLECIVDHCFRPQHCRGLCSAHYGRRQRGEEVNVVLRVMSKDPEVMHQKRLIRQRKVYAKRKSAALASGLCTKPGCGKERYSGKQCFDCWIGFKWRSICIRIRDSKGKFPTYAGLPLGFTERELIQWARENPPPNGMKRPSIDKIVDSRGYVPGNIRWLELGKNISREQKDVPDGYKLCLKCGQVKPHTFEFFSSHAGSNKNLHSSCRPCYNAHMRQYRAKRKANAPLDPE